MHTSHAQEFFRPGGSLGANHPSYIARAADHDLFTKLLTGECTCILNARQMGKTSLKNAAKEKLLAQGILLISADLALIGGQLQAEQWYCSLLQEFVRGLRDHNLQPPKSVRTFWLEHQDWSPAYRFVRGVEELLLKARPVEPPQVSSETHLRPVGDNSREVRLILAIDEIDKVRDSAGDWSDDFFAAIRAFYESRQFNSFQQRAGFLLIGVAPPSDLAKDSKATPFNIGHRIVLTDFTREEARKFENGFVLAGQSAERASALLDAVMWYTGGHPYLTQRLCYQAAQMLAQEGNAGARARELRPSTLIAEACHECFLDPGIGNNRSDDNLRNVHLQLTKRLEDDRYILTHLTDQTDLDLEHPSTAEAREERKATVLKLFERVRRGRHVRDDFRSNPWVGYLHFAGVVRSDHGHLKVRNRVYAKVFNHRWVQENMPGRFRRAERIAFFRGLATPIALALLVVIPGLLWKQLTEVRMRRAEASLRKAEGALKDFDQITAAMAELSSAAKYHPDPKLVANTFIEIASRDSLEKIQPSETNLPPRFRSWKPSEIARLNLAPSNIPLQWVDFSSDGKYAAGIYPAGESCRLTVKRVTDTAEVVSNVPCCNASVAFDRDGNRLAFLSTNGVVKMISLDDGEESQSPHVVGIPTNPFSAYRLDFNPKKPWLAITGPYRDEIRIWDLRSNQVSKAIRPKTAMVIRDLDWDDQGNRLAVIGDGSSQVAIWDFQFDPTRPTESRFDSRTPLSSVQFLPRSQTLAGIGPAGILFLWRADGSLHYDKPVPETSSTASRLVSLEEGAVASVDTKTAHLWTFKPSQIVRSVPVATEPQREIASMHFDPAGRLLLIASGSWLTLIDARNGIALDRLILKDNTTIQDAFFTPKHGDIVVLAEDGVYRWKAQVAAAGSEVEHRFSYAGRLPRPRGITAVALSADESQIALSHPSPGKQGLHVDLVDMRHLDWHRLPPSTNWGHWLGQRLLSGNSDLVREIRKLSFSPDSNHTLLIGYSSGSGKLLAWNLSEHNARLLEDAFGFGFSPDGQWLITADRLSAQCRSLPDLEKGFRLPRPYHSTLGVLFAMAALSEEEFLLAQPTDSHSVGIFKLKPGASKQVEDLVELSIPGGAAVKGLRFSEDASLLAILTDKDGTYSVQLWNLNQVGQSAQKTIGTSFFLEMKVSAQVSTRVRAAFDLTPAQLRDQDNFRFEQLEAGLRQWASLSPNTNITNEQRNREGKDALNSVIHALERLRESEWHGYFSLWLTNSF